MFSKLISGFNVHVLPKYATINNKNVKALCAVKNNVVVSTKNNCSTKPQLKEEQIPEFQTEIGSFNINYTQVGSGEHVILGLPGVFGTIEADFAPIISRLNKQRFTCVAWDAPGYGKSKLTTGADFRKMTHKNHEEDAQLAAQLMKNLGFDSYSILGWSRGACTGVHLINANPEKVKKLCIWGAPAYIDKYGVLVASTACNLDLWPKPIVQPLIDQYGEKMLTDMFVDIKQYVAESFRTGSFQMRPLLAKMPPKIPTLIIHGQNDVNTPPDHAKVYHEQIPNSKLEIWKNATHFLHLEHSEKLAKRVEKFFLHSI